MGNNICCAQEHTAAPSSEMIILSYPLPTILNQKYTPDVYGESYDGALPHFSEIFFNPDDSKPYREFLEDLREKKRRFIDRRSPCTPWLAKNKVGRLSELYPKFKIIQNPIQPLEVTLNRKSEQNVSRTIFSNTRYLTVLSRALATYPHLLKPMFLTKQNEYGFHVVRLFVNGIPSDIVIDDVIPLTPNDNPMFIQPQDDNLWPIILEKAWAKINLGYGSEQQHLPNNVLQELIGSRGENTKFVPNSLTDISRGVKSKKLVFVSANENPGYKITAHELFFISEVKTIRAGGLQDQIFKLETVYPKKFDIKSRSDSAFRNVILQQFGEEASDQIHYFTKEEMINIFQAVFITHVEPHSIRKWIESAADKTSQFFRLGIGLKSATLSVRAIQPYDGYVQGSGYSYSQMAVDVIELDNQKWLLDYDRLLEGDKSINFFEEGTYKFNPGQYLLRVRTVWAHERQLRKFTLVVEGDQSFTLEAEAQIKGYDALERIMLKRPISEQGCMDIEGIKLKSERIGSKGYIVVENSKKKKKNMTLKFQQIENILFLRDQYLTPSKEYQFSLEPNEKKVFVYQQYDVKKCAGYKKSSIIVH